MRLFRHKKANRRLSQTKPVRHHYGRWIGGVVTVAIIGVFGYGIIALLSPMAQPIKTVQVKGALRHVPHDQIRQVVNAHIVGGFFGLKVNEIKQSVRQLPWVYDLSVRRIWPDTLRITVFEQQAFARWADGGLVNTHGQRFIPLAQTIPDNLPVFAGPEGKTIEVMNRYIELTEVLKPVGASITRIEMDDRRAWRIHLNSGIDLVLGRSTGDMEIKRFINIYQRALVSRVSDIRRIDLRYTNGLAVRWKRNKTYTGNMHGEKKVNAKES